MRREGGVVGSATLLRYDGQALLSRETSSATTYWGRKCVCVCGGGGGGTVSHRWFEYREAEVEEGKRGVSVNARICLLLVSSERIIE